MRGIDAKRWLTVAIFLFALQFRQQLAGAAEVPLEVFGRLPSLENLALSPDGAKIALVKARGEDRELVIVSLAESKALVAIKLGQTKLRNIEWADNSHILLLSTVASQPMELSGPMREFAQLRIYDLGKNRLRNALDGFNDIPTMNVVIGEPMVRRDGDETYLIIPGVYVAGRTLPGLFKVNLSYGAHLIEKGDEDSRGWTVDGGGKIIAAEKYRNSQKRWSLLLRKGGFSTEAATGHEAIEVPTISGISPDLKSLWVRMRDNDSGDPIWKPLSLQDGSLGEPLVQTKGLLALFRDRYTDRIIGGVSFSDHIEYRFFDPQLQEYWHAVERGLPNQHLRIVSYSDNFRRWVVLVSSAAIGPTYVLIDFDQGSSTKLGVAYNDLSGLGEVRAITYPAADGLPIPAYLTLPENRPAKDLPLIVLPHGGPATRDTGEFDWWAQALAAQGYAVLQPNYRGSELGWRFLSSGFGQWGRKMQTDLSDGVRYLAASGLIDPKRVCIVGGSYGGYAALAGVALDPGVYRCAASIAGIADLKKFLESVAIFNNSSDSRAGRYWDRFLGATGATDPLLDALSPAKHVDAITVPVLLIHGKDDTVVPYEQSQIMATAMQKAGKPVELVTLKQEDHWLSRSNTRLQMLQSVVKFLRVNNPPD